MAKNHARSALAALAVGAALAATGCTAGAASSTDRPASVGETDSAPHGSRDGSAESAPVQQTPQSTEGQGRGQDEPGSGGKIKKRPPWCTTDALSVSLRPGRPAAGNRYGTLALTNSSGTPCRTQGWPGLQLTRSDGGPIPTEVVRDRSRPSRPLTLAAGEQASARLHWTVVPSQGDPANGKCPEPAKLRVIPPDQRTAKSTSWKLGTVCGAGEIDVLPLRTD
ncbi:DUF4232 domain-containing protein [Streptomyces ovatisporus]|uniref:DUF4232 domain-containing protein n=1 Tax=Streptomyces ovatisporus TaxID=1128682 RepID=A0ABV9ADY4_9ACTN